MQRVLEKNLQDCRHVRPCYVVIAKPAISVSTRFVYENLRLDETTRHPDIYGLADAICRQDLYGMLPYMGNVLESVTIPAYPIIGEIKERFMENGALISLMSGKRSNRICTV